MGVARFGHRPKVADTFCGGGSIPFEAARIGCDVYASDLNPIACMLTWGAFNIIGASKEKRAEIEAAQKQVAAAVDAEITRLGIEHDARATAQRPISIAWRPAARRPAGWCRWHHLGSFQRRATSSRSWCLTTRHKRYDIEIHSGVSAAEMAEAEQGTVRDGRLVHPMNPERSGVEIKTIRGDYRDADGANRNRLRLWEKSDFMPRPDDIFQERLYCVQWITKESLGAGRQETFFATVTDDDLARERKVEAIVRENLARWQDEGLVPDMPIEPGDKTTSRSAARLDALASFVWRSCITLCACNSAMSQRKRTIALSGFCSSTRLLCQNLRNGYSRQAGRRVGVNIARVFTIKHSIHCLIMAQSSVGLRSNT